jgi:enamine deaminase RidA (YjgF/YER057c/UK114 family)
MSAPGSIHRYNPGPNFSEAVGYGGVVYLAGQVALESAGGPIQDQIREVLLRLDECLAAAGSDRTRLLSALVILMDASYLPLFNELWSGWLPPGQAPARTTFVAALVSPDFLIEIAVTAAAPTSLPTGE